MSLVNSVVSYGSARLLVTAHNHSDCVALLLSSEGESTDVGSLEEEGVPSGAPLLHGQAIKLPLWLVYKVADSLEEYVASEQNRRMGHKLMRTVCVNELGVKGVVTGRCAGTFTGRALLDGHCWKSENPEKIADSLYAYTETLINGENDG